MYFDRYKYWLAYRKNNISYYRCCRYKDGCPGRCVVNETNAKTCTEHNHPPEPDRVLVDKFRKALTQRAAQESTDLYTIYWEEASQRHPDASLLYTFTSAESAMRKARRKKFSQTPSRLSDLANLFNNTSMYRIQSGTRRDPFYQTTLRLNEDSVCAIFMHFRTIEAIGHVEEIHMNDAINADPSLRLSHHMLIVHAVKNYANIPFLYAISTCKTQAIYAAIFAYIRENLSKYVTPNTIMSDFDPETQLALAYTFPDASIKGFWFYYTDAILRFMKYAQLQWEKGRSNTTSCLRMLMVLPLLPAEYMAPGLQAIRKWAAEKSILTEGIERLCTYIGHDWLRSIGADKMSIFGLPHGVFSQVQHFNGDLRNLLNAPQHTIWTIIESVTHIATRSYLKCNKQGNAIGTKPTKQQKVMETIIRNATQMWCADPIHLRNPLQFLQLSSHCVIDGYVEGALLRIASDHPCLVSSSTSPAIGCGIDGQAPMMAKPCVTPRKHRTAPVVAKDDKNCTTSEPLSDASAMPPGKQCDVMSAVASSETGKRSDPPPLAFYPKANGKIQKPIIISATQPPPLIPIERPFR